MKKLFLLSGLLPLLLAACGSGSTVTAPPANINPSGAWVATETVNGVQRAWDMNINAVNGSWSTTSLWQGSSGIIDILSISGTYTPSTAYPLNSNITVLQMGDSACKVDGISYILKSVVSGQFVSSNLYKGTEDHFVCENGGFVYKGSGTFAMTKN
ncbi:hypothetical protein [Deinococcus sp. YIM 77859]|uniref:hypothetical protein n=1 Tax=Deinococcus sp. YIM 77859 TaxID=1540221 RepID=UPI0012DFFC42|nr:hypothetical protein [Deinococcus sp. YIM 77859]